MKVRHNHRIVSVAVIVVVGVNTDGRREALGMGRPGLSSSASCAGAARVA